MIGKPEWFKRRKYTGWGLTPKTWQGWVYILFLIVPIVAVSSSPLGAKFKLWAMVIWVAVFAVDFIDLMRRLPKDERDRAHEAIAERNALWAAVSVLTIGLAFEVARSVSGAYEVDPFIMVALLAALVTKGLTNAYLERRN
jgi:cobalamin synthase